jgi:hypothetical protein
MPATWPLGGTATIPCDPGVVRFVAGSNTRSHGTYAAAKSEFAGTTPDLSSAVGSKIPFFSSASGTSRIANRSSRLLQWSFTAVRGAAVVMPGAATIAISSIVASFGRADVAIAASVSSRTT